MSLIFIYTTLVNIVERARGHQDRVLFRHCDGGFLSDFRALFVRPSYAFTESSLITEQSSYWEDDVDRVIRVVARRPKTESEEDLDVIDGKACGTTTPLVQMSVLLLF